MTASRTLAISAIAALTLAPGVEVNAANAAMIRVCTPQGVRLIALGGGEKTPNHHDSVACHAGCLAERPKLAKIGSRGQNPC